MIRWSRSAIDRSDGAISAILARQSASASALVPLAFRSLISSFMAAFSSAVNTLEAALLAGFFAAGIGTSTTPDPVARILNPLPGPDRPAPDAGGERVRQPRRLGLAEGRVGDPDARR